MKKYSNFIAFLLVLVLIPSVKAGEKVELEKRDFRTVQLAGNAYLTKKGVNGTEKLGKNGIEGWSNPDAVFSSYFRIGKKGSLMLYLQYDAVNDGIINVSLCKKTFKVSLPKGKGMKAFIGKINEVDTGYVCVNFQGVKRSGNTYAEVTSLLLEGTAVSEQLNYVDDFSFYWGRRGPSVHLNFPVPENEKIEWFYNELTVPEGCDPEGSYFMANGFAQGYFGIQVNSPSERRILFSVWSPFKTDNPNEIPDSHKIKLLKKGENVKIGEFGNEGSGGQSYLVYPWKAGNTYKFLTRIKPDGNGSTEFTAYFYAPEERKWLLIASFLRPLTDTYYSRAHSFLENFKPESGYLKRKGLYANQWFRTTDEHWICVEKDVRFTADETARKGARMDYKGGVENGKFFLQNGGFFDDYTQIGTLFPSLMQNTVPTINFSKLL